ncbi:hypothetical protein C8F04DRAFT_1365443 [Mycena alexandri]|uniref:Novel STAND NTPase 1 domain-containing protein n=1 Tax=Mycena alexandri TaxID=1745969 RepID=A0AAD6SNQ8_9AGAR|nr:hypothetical protein C8F04DRAFT_1365443 [Mycena alexandri]
MPRQATITEARLNNVSTCLTITVNTLNVLVNNLKMSGLEAILNTTQSLLKMVQTIKQDKDDCAELFEHIHQVLSAIIGVYIKSDTGAELPPSTLNQIAKFTDVFRTLHGVHTFVEAQQSGSKVKKFFRQGELSTLFRHCTAELQQGLEFFQASAKLKTTADVMADTTKLRDQAEVRHQEVLDIIEAMSSSDSASSISKIYSGSYTSSTSISMLPAEPKIFHGRDSELAEILKLFSQGTPRIAILGAGGMGKTSLARTALHHEQITTKYQENRFFITCDTASSKAELAGLIGAHLGMKPGKDLTQPVLRHLDNSPPSLLILDNLETPWEPLESRKEIEEFLSLLTDISSVALMVTMRGAERPAKVQWTRPFLLPLGPLPQEAARKMFIDVADDRHSMEEVDQVLHLTDNMPLSISLLAHLVDMEDCSTILSRWEREKTSLISEGYDKRSNLELSISLSFSSPRISSMPHSQDLLALLAILPDGLSDAELKQSQFPVEDILGCKAALLRTALAYTDNYKHLKVLVPIREYMQKLFPPTDQMIRPLLVHFHELLEVYATALGKESGAFLISRITSNYTNIQNILPYGLRLGYPDMTNSVYSMCNFDRFSRRIGREATLPRHNITSLLSSMDDDRLKVTFIAELFNFNISRFPSISQPETLIAQATDYLKHLTDLKLGSRFHSRVASYYGEYHHDMTKALNHSQISLSLARASGDYRRQSEALHLLSSIEWMCGNYLPGQAYAQEGQKLAKISGDLYQESRGIYYETICSEALGDYKHCISLSTRGRTLLNLCGMSSGHLNLNLLTCQAEVHRHKSEYNEAHQIQTQILQETTHNPYQHAFTLLSISELEVLMGSSDDEIQRKIDASKAIFEREGFTRGVTACECTQADLNLREGDISTSLFCKCLKSGWGSFDDAVTYCLERLGNYSRWEGSQHPLSWTTVFLAHSLKGKQRLGIHKALQFLGDVFLKANDEVTAISLFTLALEGFTNMDVNQSRAECIIRLGDISKKNADLLKALELYESARPLFECASQVKQVQDIDERLAEISEDIKKQHQINLAQLAELNTPGGKIGEVVQNLFEGGSEEEDIGLPILQLYQFLIQPDGLTVASATQYPDLFTIPAEVLVQPEVWPSGHAG